MRREEDVRRLFLVLAGALAAVPGCGEEEASSPPSTAPAATSTNPSTTSTSLPPATATPTTQRSAAQGAAVVPCNITVPNLVGEDLQLAQDTMQAAGLYSLRSHDASGRGRFQVVDRAWKVCDQTPPGGSKVAGDQLVDFAW